MKRHGSYGTYTCGYGTVAASPFFSRKLGRKVSTASVYSIKMAYLENVKQRRSADSDGEVIDLPLRMVAHRYF